MRQTWSDDRLDGLRQRVDLGFKHVDEGFAVMNERFDRIELDQRQLRAEVNSRFDRLQQTLMVTGGGIIATLIAGIVALAVS